jgi:uncharacterized lipoprotein YajG
MKKSLVLVALLGSLSLAACATDDSGSSSTTPPDSTPVAGMIVAGDTDAFLSKDQDTFFATLYPAQFTTCGFSQPSGDHLIVSIPKVVGDYPMSLSRNMTFVVGNDNKIAIDGHIVVTEVTATKIKGGIVSKFDSQNEVNGSFEIPICAE